MSSNATIERAWQEMRFLCASAPGPLVARYVHQLADLEQALEDITPISEEARLVFEADLNQRVRHVVDECRRTKASLG